MGQGERVGPVESSIGYVLKQASVVLRGAMDDVLRPLRLTTPQYACLELLEQRPGLSNAALARGAFVTRQSMNVVLRGLEDRGLVVRPASPERGRELPASLTTAGRRALAEASVAVREVERRMLGGIAARQQEVMLAGLTACIRNLSEPG